MPRAKQPMGYPSAYYDMIEAVSRTGKTFIFPRRDRKQAELTRFQLYSFFKACRSSDQKREQDIGEAAYGLVLSIRGADLIISVRDNQDEAIELKQALQQYEKEAEEERARYRKESGVESQPTRQVQQAQTPQADAQEDLINLYLKGGKK